MKERQIMSGKVKEVSSQELKEMVEQLPEGVIIEVTFEEEANENDE